MGVGVQIDRAVVEAFLKALPPAAVEASEGAAQQLETGHDAALAPWRLAVERARDEAERAERQYRALEPENRLRARRLETEWEKRLLARRPRSWASTLPRFIVG